jgi:hypothetical protein
MKRKIFATGPEGTPGLPTPGIPIPEIPIPSFGGKSDSEKSDKDESKEKTKDINLRNKDTLGGSEIEYYTAFNELANTFKDVFKITDPTYTDPVKLRSRFLDSAGYNFIVKDPSQLLAFINQLKDTLFAISSYRAFEPNIAQLLANFAINLFERTRDYKQVMEKLVEIKTMAQDLENPKDGYIISLLRGNIHQANILLILSDISSEKGVSNDTLNKLVDNQQIANKMFGSKSSELLNAQYLENLQAAAWAAEIQKSLAAYQALIPIGAQRAKWRRDLHTFAESVWKNPVVKNLIDTPIVSMLGAAKGGYEQFKDSIAAPWKSIYGGGK